MQWLVGARGRAEVDPRLVETVWRFGRLRSRRQRSGRGVPYAGRSAIAEWWGSGGLDRSFFYLHDCSASNSQRSVFAPTANAFGFINSNGLKLKLAY
jgi:hypothetical protein